MVGTLYVMQDGKGIKRASHKRTCKRKVPSDAEAKSIAVKHYLSRIGLTWPVFARVHSRLAHGPFMLESISTC